MAESIGELYLRLGLSLSDLTSGFIAAERSVNENMSRLNREMQVIRLRAEVELSGLDEVEDAEQRFQVRTNALNQLMQAQRQRISLANAAYEDMRQRLGETSAQTQRAQVALERERAALARLEEELRQLNETQNETNEGQSDLASMLSGLATRFRGPIAAAAAFVGSLKATYEATRSLVEEFRELQQQSYELNLPVEETKEFLRQLKLAGGDIGDFEGFVRGITDAWIKGDVLDPETLAMKKYGVEIETTTGRLKDIKEITEELYQGYEKAKANGEGLNYLQMLGGESGIRDAIQLFERYEEAKEDAEKIFDAGLNAAEMHEAERELNLLDEQMREFGAALKDAVTPAGRAMFKELFEIFHDGTEFIVESKDKIQELQFIAIEAANSIKSAFNDVSTGLKNLTENDGFSQFTEAQNERLKEWHKEIEELGDFDNTLWGRARDTFLDVWFGDILENAKLSQMEYNQEVEETTRKTEELEAASKEMTDTLSYGLRDSLQRAQQFNDEIKDIDIDLNFDDGSIDKSMAKLDQWFEQETRGLKKVTEEQKAQIEEMLENEELSAEKRNELQDLLASKFKISKEEETALYELYAKKKEQIERESADRIEEIRNELAAKNKTDLQNQLDEWDAKCQEWINIGMSRAEAETLAEQQKYDAIKKLAEDFAETYNALQQTELENTLARIEKEKEAWIQKGVDEVNATRLAAQQKADAERNAAMNALKNDIRAYRKFRDFGYEGLRDEKLRQLHKAGIGDEDLASITPQLIRDFRRASKQIEDSLLPNFRPSADNASTDLNAMTESVQNVTSAIEQANANIDKYNEYNKYNNAENETDNETGDNSPTEELNNQTADLAANVENINSLFDNLAVSLDEINATIADMPELLDEVNAGLGAFIEQLSNLPEMAQSENPAPAEETQKNPEIPDFSALTDAISQSSDKINEANSIMYEANQAISRINEWLEPITERMSEATDKILNATDSISDLKSSLDKLKEIKVEKPHVETTVQINEATAWDSEHIRKLADKVADKLKPVILNAIGGSNSY